MNFEFNETVISVLLLLGVTVTLSYNYLATTLANSFIYYPYKATQLEFDKLSKAYGRNEIFVNFKATDKINLTGMLINYNKKAKWNDDIIFLFSHGNGSWIGGLFNSHQLEILSNYGSIFVYDYRQYGLSDGTISEDGTYSDILGAWRYLTENKKINPKNIVVYGHSLGGAVSTHLLATLIKKSQDLPRALILDGTFSNIVDMGNHLIPGFGDLAVHNYNNIKNLQYINEIVPVLVMHSKSDDVIPYNQSLKIKNTCKCTHITIDGSHNNPVYNNKVINFIAKVCKN